MKPHQISPALFFGQTFPPPLEGEDPFYKVLPELRIVKTRSMPLLGDLLLNMKPHRSSFSNSMTRSRAQRVMRSV
jgi:hypothetical protein